MAGKESSEKQEARAVSLIIAVMLGLASIYFSTQAARLSKTQKARKTQQDVSRKTLTKSKRLRPSHIPLTLKSHVIEAFRRMRPPKRPDLSCGSPAGVQAPGWDHAVIMHSGSRPQRLKSAAAVFSGPVEDAPRRVGSPAAVSVGSLCLTLPGEGCHRHSPRLALHFVLRIDRLSAPCRPQHLTPYTPPRH